MKKIVLFVLMSFLVVTASAQEHKVDFKSGRTSTFMKRANRFMEETKENALVFTSEDWDYSFSEYSKMIEEYQDISEDLAEDDRSAFLKLSGEYLGLATKTGATKLANEAKKLLKDITPFFEGFLESLKGVVDSLGAPLE